MNFKLPTSFFSKQNKKLISKSQPFLKPFFPPPFLPVVSGVSYPCGILPRASPTTRPRSRSHAPRGRKCRRWRGNDSQGKGHPPRIISNWWVKRKPTKNWKLLFCHYSFFLGAPVLWCVDQFLKPLIWTHVIASWNLGRICFIFFEAFRFICQITMFAVAIYRDVTGSMAIASHSQVRWVRWWIFRKGPW